MIHDYYKKVINEYLTFSFSLKFQNSVTAFEFIKSQIKCRLKRDGLENYFTSING